MGSRFSLGLGYDFSTSMKLRLASLVSLLVLSVSARAELPNGLAFDDGFAWFECHNFESVENNVVKGNWVLECSLRIWGTVPDRSGFKIQLKQNGKLISENLTDGYPVKLGGGPAKGMNLVGFWKDKSRTSASGPMTVEIFYIDGQTNKEYLARTCQLDVRKTARTRGPVKSRTPYAPSFYVNRHAEILSTILYFRDYEFPSYVQLNGLTWYSERRLELLMNYSENENFSGPALGRIVVEVDGKPVDMKVPNNEIPQDQMGYGELAGKFNVEHSDRDAPKYFNSGPAYRERIGFVRRSMILPIQWGPKLEGRTPSTIFTNDHPGNWKITYLIDRKPVRIWRFKVGADGLPVPHPEQGRGLNLAPNAILVDTEIPGQGGDFDGRLTSQFVKLGAFFGRAWATEGMRALAAQVPAKGKPFPVSSAGKA